MIKLLLLILPIAAGLTIKPQSHQIIGVVDRSPRFLQFYLYFKADREIGFYTFEANHAGKCVISKNFNYYRSASVYNDTFSGTLSAITVYEINCFAFRNRGNNDVTLEYMLSFNTEKIWGGKMDEDEDVKTFIYDGKTGFGVIYGIVVIILCIILGLILI